MLRLFSVVAAVFTLAALSTVASAAGAPSCRPGELPAFRFGFAALKDQLRVGMGDPVECEHDTGVGGNTWMKTTTGLAFYHKITNTSSVIVSVSGQTYHWALTTEGVAFWQAETTDTPDPPATAPVVSDAICSTSVDATPPFDPLRGACIALYVTQLGDPVAPAASLSPSAMAPIPGSRSGQPDSAPLVLRSPPSNDQLSTRLRQVDALIGNDFPRVDGQICNQTSDWTASDITVTFVFYDQYGLETPDSGRYLMDSVAPGDCRPFRTTLTALSRWATIGVRRTNWTWTP